VLLATKKGQDTMHRSIRALLTTTAVAVPAGMAWVAARPSAVPRTAPARATPTAVPHKTTSHLRTAASHQAPATRKITGPVEDMQWGPVQVTIIVKGKRITAVHATAPIERPRSAFINQQAIPWLRQEVLQAQSANIDIIGGATLTSEAFDLSLQGTLKEAHL
jgi:uncharacterized protein with FMN-binding domain